MKKEEVEKWKQELTELDKKRTAIIQLLEAYGSEVEDSKPTHTTSNPKPSFSISGRVVDAAIELIHKLGRPVKNSEIMEFVKEKQLTLGDATDEGRTLAAILSQETRKKKNAARLKKAARGYYEINQ
jgi:hypothetical protein